MPTGYTADLYDGKDVTFQQFAMNCARAFGALIEMRDSPVGATIPEKFEADGHYRRALIAAGKRLEELRAMTVAQAEDAAIAEYTKNIEAWEQCRAQAQAREARYRAMIDAVDAWRPPTPDHAELKKFMRSQLSQSLGYDCHVYERPTPMSATEWLDAQIKSATRDIDYYREQQQDAEERASERTAWVKALRESLR